MEFTCTPPWYSDHPYIATYDLDFLAEDYISPPGSHGGSLLMIWFPARSKVERFVTSHEGFVFLYHHHRRCAKPAAGKVKPKKSVILYTIGAAICNGYCVCPGERVEFDDK